MTTQIRNQFVVAAWLATVGLLSLCAVGAWKQSAVAQIETATAPVARIEVTARPLRLAAVSTDHAPPEIESVAFLGRMTVTATRLR